MPSQNRSVHLAQVDTPTRSSFPRPRTPSDARCRHLLFPEQLLERFLAHTGAVQAEGLKSFGLFVADPSDPHYPFVVHDVVYFDPHRNRRNEPTTRAAFEAQGAYFRAYDDAGFVADPSEVLAAYQAVEAMGLDVVAPFHSHRRQPANFSSIDLRLHNPAFPWHLIVSYQDERSPVVRAFRVDKDPSDFGISATDVNEDSQLAYEGPEVAPLPVVRR